MFAAGRSIRSSTPFHRHPTSLPRLLPELADRPVLELILGLAAVMEMLLRPFGQTGANDALVRGINVGWGLVLDALGVIGLAWTGLTLLIGWAAFRRKELAIYSGQG